jgi:hypothetical protein
MADVIQTMWIGPRLTTMEQLCIKSFLRNGHPFHLYVYEDVEGVPEGTVVLDGNEILPASRIFQYKEHKSYAGFSNFFRYRLLLEKGGWWVDTDMVCLAPFDFGRDQVFSSEGINGRRHVSCCALRFPPGSAAMQYAWDTCQTMNPAELKWGQSGPGLAQRAAQACGLEAAVADPEVFCPVHFSQWETMLDGSVSYQFGEATRAVHLWNELWRREGRTKDAAYPPDCLYEQLKRRYL